MARVKDHILGPSDFEAWPDMDNLGSYLVLNSQAVFWEAII